MKNLLKLLIAFFALSIIASCNKDDDNNTPITPTPTDTITYKPRFFLTIIIMALLIYDVSNTANVKQYAYAWSNTSHKFEYSKTIDTSSSGDYRHYISKNWPSTVTDPVATGVYGVHIQDRSANNNTYFVHATDNPLYAINTSTMTDDHTNIPLAWTNAGVIDGYALSNEYYNSTSYASSRIFFDLNNDKYIIHRSSSIVENDSISNFVKTPLGNMTSTSIDFTLADAVFYIERGLDDRYPYETLIYFLDYETMQYVLVTRKTDSITVNGKNTLRTTTWQPISNLIDSWKVDLQ